jgi:hypothetical protein
VVAQGGALPHKDHERKVRTSETLIEEVAMIGLIHRRQTRAA